MHIYPKYSDQVIFLAKVGNELLTVTLDRCNKVQPVMMPMTRNHFNHFLERKSCQMSNKH